MLKIWQRRFIRNSNQNGIDNVVWEGGRIKEARGQCKSLLLSHMEMIHKHEFFPEAMVEAVIDSELQIYLAEYYDDEGLMYSIRYEIENV